MRRLVWLGLMSIACGRTEVVTFTLPPTVTVDAGRDAGSRDAGADAGVDAGFDAGPIDAGFVPKPCLDGTFSLSPAEPVVMLVLDRSCSMDALISSTQTRWEAVVSSLEATLPQVDRTMQLGGLAYPISIGEPCVIPPQAGIWPARGNVSLLVSNLRSLRPEGPTPTPGDLAGLMGPCLHELSPCGHGRWELDHSLESRCGRLCEVSRLGQPVARQPDHADQGV